MDYRKIMKKIAINYGVDEFENNNGKFKIILEGNTVYGSENGKYFLLEAELKTKETSRNIKDLTEYLISKNLGLIQEHRVCLSINEQTNEFNLHQRIPTDGLTVESLENNLHKFGGCLNFFIELTKQ